MRVHCHVLLVVALHALDAPDKEGVHSRLEHLAQLHGSEATSRTGELFGVLGTK